MGICLLSIHNPRSKTQDNICIKILRNRNLILINGGRQPYNTVGIIKKQLEGIKIVTFIGFVNTDRNVSIAGPSLIFLWEFWNRWFVTQSGYFYETCLYGSQKKNTFRLTLTSDLKQKTLTCARYTWDVTVVLLHLKKAT